MSQTVIGIFDHTSEAQEAVSNLLSNGFSKESLDLSTRAAMEGISSSYDDEESHAGISGFFGNLFGSSDEDAAKYSQVGQRGAIVTVHASSSEQAESAAQILDNYGALDVNERAESYKATGTVAPATTGTSDTIKIIEEKMQVGKREVETGGVRLRSRIVERAVHEEVRLRSERVHVERTNVSRPATAADLAAFKDATITMKKTAEVPVVSKEAFVTGEVSLGKEVEEKNQTVQGTVRKTEVDTENFTDEKSSLAADKTNLSAIKGDKL
ncbi:MAG: YsnF/AvaK domain-containing protein [Janthinobacterium lividum]